MLLLLNLWQMHSLYKCSQEVMEYFEERYNNTILIVKIHSYLFISNHHHSFFDISYSGRGPLLAPPLPCSPVKSIYYILNRVSVLYIKTYRRWCYVLLKVPIENIQTEKTFSDVIALKSICIHQTLCFYDITYTFTLSEFLEGPSGVLLCHTIWPSHEVKQ